MPLQIIRGDITRMRVDAIVNATDERLTGGGGVDRAIHRAAGPELDAACRDIGYCPTGAARITPGFRLPARYIIHTAGPIWKGGHNGEELDLERCYYYSLTTAVDHGCRSIAFPVIATGAYGFPKEQAMRLAVDTITDFLDGRELMVYLVVYDKAAFSIGSSLYGAIRAFIDDRYVDDRRDDRLEQRRAMEYCAAFMAAPAPAKPLLRASGAAPEPATLDEALKMIDESFTQMLLRLIDEKGMKDSACYKRANIDRKLFSKIRSDRLYRPSKPTVLAFAIALELPLAQTRELLLKAGFALSPSSKFDIIVEFFIRQGIYDIYQINEALFAFDQNLLGG